MMDIKVTDLQFPGFSLGTMHRKQNVRGKKSPIIIALMNYIFEWNNLKFFPFLWQAIKICKMYNLSSLFHYFCQNSTFFSGSDSWYLESEYNFKFVFYIKLPDDPAVWTHRGGQRQKGMTSRIVISRLLLVSCVIEGKNRKIAQVDAWLKSWCRGHGFRLFVQLGSLVEQCTSCTRLVASELEGDQYSGRQACQCYFGVFKLNWQVDGIECSSEAGGSLDVGTASPADRIGKNITVSEER